MQFEQLRRREFIALIGSVAAAWPLAARAQHMRRVGILVSFGDRDPEGQSRVSAFRQELERLGWSVGGNVHIDYRWVSDLDHAQASAAELVGLRPEVILAFGNANLAALRKETRSIPIVVVQAGDLVGSGFVASLAHPGGNITGFTNWEYSIGGKWFEILREIVPGLAKVITISNPSNLASTSLHSREIEDGAHKAGIQFTAVSIRETTDFNDAIERLARTPSGGLIVLPDNTTFARRELIIALAARHRLPAVYPLRFFVRAGGLISYGVDQIDQSRRAASYVDRILKGEKPSELPVQAPTKYELVINLKTAKALGLDVPLHLQQRADALIE
jgi:putative ABC transport system substrate-binding protein